MPILNGTNDIYRFVEERSNLYMPGMQKSFFFDSIPSNMLEGVKIDESEALSDMLREIKIEDSPNIGMNDTSCIVEERSNLYMPGMQKKFILDSLPSDMRGEVKISATLRSKI